MGIFGYIAKKKEQFKAKQLNLAEIRARTLESKAEKHAKELESLASHNKALTSALKRQEEAKAVIQESRRAQHPLLFKIGDSVKNKFAEAQKNRTHQQFSNSKSSNVFGQVSNQTPYWLKQSKQSNKDLFGNNSKSHSVFTKN